MATSVGFLKEDLPICIVLKENNSYFCECCTCILGGFSCMKQHVAGKRHKKEMQRSGIVIPPKNEIVQVDKVPDDSSSTSNKAVYVSYNSNGIVECTDKWNSFQCIFCNCVLNAGDVNLHVGGKRHTKRANQAALENFISKRNEKCDPAETDAKNVREDAEENTNFTKLSADAMQESSQNISPEANSSVKTEEDVLVKTAPQLNSSGITAQQTNTAGNTSKKICLQADLTNTTTQSNSSAKAVVQTNTSVKSTPRADALIKAVPQRNTSVNNFPQTTAPLKILQTSTPEKITSETTASRKTDSQTNTSVKSSPETKISLVKDAYQKNVSGKTTSIKALPQMNASIKATNISLNSTSIDSQAIVSIKGSPQMNASLQTHSTVSSLNEYLTTVSNPIVGLNYVVEILITNEQSKFQCNLCKVNGDSDIIKDHINSSKHHLEYLRTVDPIKAAEVKALKETERNQKILEHVIELERKKGRGTILVKTTETGKDNGSNVDDLQKTVATTRKQFSNYAYAEDSAIQIVAQEFLSKEVIRNAQKKDPQTSKIIKDLMNDVSNSSYIIHDDILYERRNGKYRVVVAKRMKQAIYESYHFSLCRKTPGAVTYINDSYSWPGINDDITKFAKQCYVCQIRKLRQLSGGEAIPILVRRGQGKRKPSP